MARGFESKDIEFQQAEAMRAKTRARALSPAEREAQTHRGTLELALARARGDLALARSDAHRHMLAATIRVLEEQLENLRP